MKVICSINGIDGVGKTTQVKIFEKECDNFIKTVYGLENYKGFPKLTGQELHKWWFESSTIEGFCDAFYESLANRNLEIMNSNKNIIILDKGIINFEARIRATLKIRGFSQEEIENNIKKSKIKYNFKDIENLKIIITNKVLNERKINKSKYSHAQIALYQKYELEQVKEINTKKKRFDYTINYDLGIDEINRLIRKYIILKLAQRTSDIDVKKSLHYINENIRYIDLDLCNNIEGFKKNYESIIKKDDLKSIQLYNSIVYDTNKNIEKYKGLLLEKANKNPKIKYCIKTKEVLNYKIPFFYKSILEKFTDDIKSKIKNIELLLVHGSAGRECMHEKWSDLDIIICIDKYDFNQIDQISKIIDKYKHDVKIGSTIYSRLEIESLNVDAKTLYALYQMQRNEIFPIIYEKVEIPVITNKDLISKNLNVLPEAIHKLKRLLYSDYNTNKEAIIKTVNLIMKVILITNNIFPKSYEDVFYNFAKLYRIEYFNILKYLNDEELKDDKLINYAKKIIEVLINE